ncbi:NPCBM/NEW2 domain-containing protein [Roseimaritima sediminicola]|uniref:NPCBM/NEW2 domain-containing protein n=1 Tax=Roseimaritima sediminicola TaxID=2662066 RepID=UPI00138692B8|nr:NPCBM/NEW2 domain-containing protein [Roseimaritima sediminicola]
MFFLATAVLLAGGLFVEVQPVDGEAYQAELVGAVEGAVQLNVDGETRQVPLADLRSLRRSEADDRVAASMTATFRDGTHLPIDDVTVAEDRVALKLRRQGVLEAPLKQLAVLRLRPAAAAVDDQWAGYTSKPQANDQLVIRRGTDTLDAVGGAVTGIDNRTVQFLLDGAPIDAPFDRLEGIVFGGADAPSQRPEMRITDVYGAVWNARAIYAADQAGHLVVDTVGGLKHPIRIDLLRSIELSGGVQMLTEAEPAQVTFQPFIALPEGVSQSVARGWLGPRTRADQTLVLRSRSVLRYRVEPGFSRFVASVQIDPTVTLGGQCEVRVLLNDRVAWQKTLRIGQPAQEIELPLDNASRLSIEVDYGDDGDVGDIVFVREPRLLK